MNFAVILSGGVGSRMRADGFPKQYIEILGKPVLMYCLETFQAAPEIDKIIIVADESWHNDIRTWMTGSHITKFAAFAKPGASRQGSIFNGLQVCMDMGAGEKDNAVIHDGVRPLASQALISGCVSAMEEYDGCLPVVPVTDTTYVSQDGREVFGLLDRSTLFSGQSPEVFRLKAYYEINKRTSEAERDSIRGAAELAYRNGMKIGLVPGDYFNFKLTTATDLDRFRAVLENKQ